MSTAEDNSPGPAGSGVDYWLGEVPARVLSVVACIVLFFMMVLTFVDVGGRYLFASPLPAAYEIISYTMPFIIFCALPLTNRTEGHVTIDLLDTFMPQALGRWQAVVVDLISAAATAFLAWRLAARSYDHYRFNEVTDELYLDMWIFSAAMAVLCAIGVIAFLMNALGYLTGARDWRRHDGFRAT